MVFATSPRNVLRLEGLERLVVDDFLTPFSDAAAAAVEADALPFDLVMGSHARLDC